MGEPELYPFQLIDVRLFEARVERLKIDDSTEDNSEEGDSGTIRLALDKRITKHPDSDLVSVFLDLSILGAPKEEPSFKIDFTLEGLFEANNRLDEIDQEIWQGFEKNSSLSLLWPYAREYLHNFIIRMRADLPLLPTLDRLSLADLGEVESDDEQDIGPATNS